MSGGGGGAAYIPTATAEGQTYQDISLGLMVSVKSPGGLVWLPVPKAVGQMMPAYGLTWLTVQEPHYGLLQWVYIQPIPSLLGSFQAAASASSKGPSSASGGGGGSMVSLSSNMSKLSLVAPTPPKPSIVYKIVQGPATLPTAGTKSIPLRVLPMPPPKPFRVFIMRGFNPAIIDSVPDSEVGKHNFIYKLPMILTYPDLPDDMRTMIASFGGGAILFDADIIKFNTFAYMKNFLGVFFKTKDIIPGIKLNDIWFLWGEDYDTPPPELSIIVNHKNELHSFTKEQIGRLKHIFNFIPYYYQLRKYQNKLWQRYINIIRRILAGEAVPEFGLTPPYDPALVTGLGKIDLIQSRILFNPSIMEDFNNGVVYNILYKAGASAITHDEAPLIEKLIKNVTTGYLYKGYIALGDAVADPTLQGGRRRQTRRSRRSRLNTRSSLRK